MIVHYQSYFRAKDLLPEYIETFRFNSITRKDYVSFVNHPDAIALVSSTGDMTTTPPAKTGLVHNFKVTSFLSDSFKNSIKRDASLFNTFKEGNYWGAWRRNALATTRAQDIAGVINPDYRPVTEDDVNIFKEKQKSMCAAVDKTS